jgi:prophage regulatory protein
METNQIEKNSTSSIRFLRWPEVQHRVGFSKSYAYALQAKGKFPKPIKLIEGGRAAGYIESEINEYIASRIDASRLDQNL